MYDINISATSIPSDIHLISSAPTFNANQHEEQFYNQTSGSLANVLAHKHVQSYHDFRLGAAQHKQPTHQRLRTTRSSLAECNQERQGSPRQHIGKASTRFCQPQHWPQLHCNQAAAQQQQQQSGPIATPCQPHFLTIEELKTTRNSCWLCGCNWREDHVSLDCPECDGYALSRPCPNCDGKCKQIWQRNISATHDKHRALWMGQCAFEQVPGADSVPNSVSPAAQQPQQRLGPATGPDSATGANSNAAAPATNTSAATITLRGPGRDRTSVAANLSNSMASRAHFHLVAPAPSSVCSSQPSSAATSDDEPDDFLSI